MLRYAQAHVRKTSVIQISIAEEFDVDGACCAPDALKANVLPQAI